MTKHRKWNGLPSSGWVWLFFLMLIMFSFKARDLEVMDLVKWIKIEQVEVQLENSPKPIVIDFVADWCAWCKVMERKTFSDEKVSVHINQNFYAIRLDYDSTEKFTFQGEEYTSQEFANKHGISSLPGTLFISADLKNSMAVSGYLGPKKFMKNANKFEARMAGR